MAEPTVHGLTRAGDLAAVRYWLEKMPEETKKIEINAYDAEGKTPLMYAVQEDAAPLELVQTLLDHGADPHLHSREKYRDDYSVLALAAGAGDPGKVQLLLQLGADLHYRREKGYTVMIDAVYGRKVRHDARLLDLLRLLTAAGADLNATTTYGESTLRVLSQVGRFDAVELLLQAGADENQIAVTPLHRAVEFGTIAQVQAALGNGKDLETRDYWSCTPWLLAIQRGDIEIAELLQAHGADTQARGHCGAPPLFAAIDGGIEMVRWLLAQGASLEETDEFGGAALAHAAEQENEAIVQLLLQAGANVRAGEGTHLSPLYLAERGPLARRLLDAGAHPGDLQYEARRDILGLPPEPDLALLDVSQEEYLAGKNPRFGIANPEKMQVPFWEGMIRSGAIAYWGWEKYAGDQPRDFEECIWCAQRLGHSLTILPDGRIVQVAGEHEDHYDPDFYIYNDVFVHHPDGRIDIYGYPAAIFPPTDFHTATLFRDCIYLIGSFGHRGERRYGTTPVYRLDLHTWEITSIKTSGTVPGWIHKHRAVAISDHGVRITGGEILSWVESKESCTANQQSFVLDLQTGLWRIDGNVEGFAGEHAKDA